MSRRVEGKRAVEILMEPFLRGGNGFVGVIGF